MSRSLRSNQNLPRNFQYPDLRRGRIVQFNMNANANAGNANAVAPVIAAAPPAPVTITWTENPNIGKFNPGTKAGQAIFERKTKSLPADKRLSLARKDAPTLKRLLDVKANEFGPVATRIPIEFAPDGTPTKHINLLKEYGTVTVEQIQREALKRFGTAVGANDPLPQYPFMSCDIDPEKHPADQDVFYSQVDANVLSEWIKNTLTDDVYSTLMLKRETFTFVDQVTGS